MGLIRWDPFKQLDTGWFGRRDVGAGHQAMTVADWAPSVDIKETNEEFVIKVELPDVQKKNIHVSVDNGVLTLKGERKQEKEEKTERFHRIERSYGTFMRSFTLPENVNADKVLAEYKGGMLDIHLPKDTAKISETVEVKVH